ncbi:hypothetical protein CC78DRAFT_538287 [Lojkania enalia]|uniref:Transcriptional co-activator n=1 Tax=Lojkania enalia TaxID=147567 RepID=A0A9P4K083_9PLEO|nr:hypothetical protein CC78DRAFT_538287 [Didymosphaeria enalia]
MATIRPDAINVSTTPTLSLKSLPTPTPASKPAEKRTVTAPRIDVEPLYTAVKSAISDVDWATYKATLSQFLLGNLNQEELTRRLSPIISTPALEHAHNQFVVAIYGNVFRDTPEPGVASWVSASDKPTSGVQKSTGDGAEKRLKSEVMQLSRRERKRLKTIQESPYDPFTQAMQEYHDARRIKAPDTGPASAGGFQKTNWELEIRKRYTQPLFTETHEFPDESTLATRILPICYEYGLPSGHSPDCASFMNIATETYIKEALTNLFQRVSSNGPGYIRTAEYKRKVEREEDKVARGEITRTGSGLLPVELEEQRKRRPLCMEDLRVAMSLGDQYLGQVPLIAGQINNGTVLDIHGIETINDIPESTANGTEMKRSRSSNAVNGIPASGVGNKPDDVANGWTFDFGEPMVLDDEFAWQGAGVQEVDSLNAVLDGCLAIGV